MKIRKIEYDIFNTIFNLIFTYIFYKKLYDKKSNLYLRDLQKIVEIF